MLRRLLRSRPGSGSSRSPARRARPRPRTCWPAVLADAGADGGHRRVLQQRARPAADRAARRPARPATWSSRWARAGSATSPSCARSRRPTSRWCSTSARRTSASSAPRRRSRRPRASWSRRSPADGAAVLNADDPLVAAMAQRTDGRVLTFGRAAGADVRLGDVELDDLGRASFDLTHGGDDRARRAAAASASTRPPTPPPTAAAALAAGLPLAERRREPARDRPRSRSGGWRSTSAPTGWSSSTTPTTPTPTRCAPRWRRSPGWASAAAGGRSPCWARCASSGPAPRRSTARSGALAHAARASTRSWSSGDGAARRSTTRCVEARGRRRHDAPRRAPSNEAGGVVARECGRSRRRAGQGVAGRAARTGRRDAAGRPTDDGRGAGR